MSRIISTAAIRGAHRIVDQAQDALERAIHAKGRDHPVEFPNTAYHLPVIYSMLGLPIGTLGELEPVLERARSLLPPVPTERLWLPYLGDTLDAGMATLFAEEIIEASRYAAGPHPVNGIWIGAAGDVILRERGIQFVDGTAPGFAACVGACPNSRIAVEIARELQERNLYVFLSASTDGRTMAEQLAEEGVQLGWETRLVPYGRDITATIYSLGFASRVALSFGGVKPGEFRRNLLYSKNRIFAFVLALGEVDEEKYATAAGALNYGFPTIADTNIPEILPTGICTYEHVVANVPHDKMVSRALEVRGCKVTVTEVPVPIPYGPAFEGERVRKEDVYLEFGGNRTMAFEHLMMKDLGEIEDGEIVVRGPEIDDVPEGTALPLGIIVEVAGRKMQRDFEPVLERHIHNYINGAQGIFHLGQRDIVWLRISKAAHRAGFKVRHLGSILHAKLHGDFPAIIDKIRVVLHTEEAPVKELIGVARAEYKARNDRIANMTDESTDIFYSCTLCQSFAPNHVCMITPERLGLCGAYNWLDGKACHEIQPTGPNQPVRKGAVIDPVRGQFRGMNEFVYTHSNRTLERFNAYSAMVDPMTSCGCFEVIVGIVPECNGFMLVNREFTGMTPVGMTFSSLAGFVGGGVQTPGFVGIGKTYITSRKFLSGDGGFFRIVWMPGELRGALGEALQARAEELGDPEFLSRLGDETITVDPMKLRGYLEERNHPALTMEPLL